MSIPTKEGYYWARYPKGEWEPMKLECDCFGELCVQEFGTDETYPIEHDFYSDIEWGEEIVRKTKERVWTIGMNRVIGDE